MGVSDIKCHQLTININLFKQLNINQIFDKIQMILMMKTSISNNRISRLKKYISKQRVGCSCNLYNARNCTQENVKCQHEEKWFRSIVIEQVNYYFPLIFLERRCARKLSKSICVYFEKIKAKCMKEDVWKSFFR